MDQNVNNIKNKGDVFIVKGLIPNTTANKDTTVTQERNSIWKNVRFS